MKALITGFFDLNFGMGGGGGAVEEWKRGVRMRLAFVILTPSRIEAIISSCLSQTI